MKDPLLVQIFIRGAKDEDIIFNLPLQKQVKLGHELYFITIDRLGKVLTIHEYISCTMKDITLMIFNRRENQYQLLHDHPSYDNEELVFSREFLTREIPLIFVIVWNDKVYLQLEYLKLKKDVLVIERDSILKERRTNEQLELFRQELALMEQKILIKEKEKVVKLLQEDDVDCTEDFDVATLYSNPIVAFSGKGPQNLPPVGYYDEIATTKEVFQRTKLAIRYNFNIATKENLKKTLDRQPKVLQIICHGDFDQGVQQFYLAFEKNGVMDKIFLADLQVLFSSIQTESIQLVLLSCCHSGELAKIILKSTSIPYVIAVSSEYKIEDKASQIFSKTLYDNLILKKSVEDSVLEARISIKNEQGSDCYTCCCAHLHDPNCPFDQGRIDKLFSLQTMHQLHSPQCNCKYKKEGKHYWDYPNQFCKWGMSYLIILFKEEEVEEKSRDQTWYLETIDGNSYLNICCCDLYQQMTGGQESNKTIHDESLKFQLFTRSETKLIPFEKKKNGLPEEINSYEIAKINIQGRSWELYQIFKFISDTNQQILYVVGDQGSGRTYLVSQAIRYAKERDHGLQWGGAERFNSLIDIKGDKCIDMIEDKLNDQMGREPKKQMQKYKNKKIVIAFDDADAIYKYKGEDFDKFLKKFRSQYPKINIIVIINIKTSKKFRDPVKIIQIPHMNQYEATQLFLSQLNNREKNPVYENQIEQSQLFNYIVPYPRFIIEAAKNQNLTNQTFIQTVEHLKQIYEQKQPLSEEKYKGIIEDLKATPQGEDTLKLLNILSLLTDGITKNELEHSKFLEHFFKGSDTLLDNMINKLKQFDLVDEIEFKQFDQISYKAKSSYSTTNLFKKRADLKNIFNDVLEHQCSMIQHFLNSKAEQYQERLFDYSMFTKSSFVSLLNKDIMNYTQQMDFNINLNEFFRLNKKNWKKILKQIEEQFSGNIKNFIQDVIKLKKSSQTKLSYNENFDQLFRFVSLLCRFTELVMNVFYMLDDKKFPEIFDLSCRVLDKTSNDLLKPLLDSHEIFKNRLISSTDSCHLTLIKIYSLGIDFTISQFQNLEQPKKKKEQIKQYLDDFRKKENQIQSTHHEIIRCLEKEIRYMTYILDVLPIILEIKVQSADDDPADYGPVISQFEKDYNNLKALNQAEKKLQEILKEMDDIRNKSIEESLLYQKINIVRISVQLKKLYNENERRLYFNDLNDVSEIKQHLEAVCLQSDDDDIQKSQIQLVKCQYFGDWLKFLANHLAQFSDEPSKQAEFESSYKYMKKSFTEQMQANQNIEIKKTLDQINIITFELKEFDLLTLYVNLLRVKFLILRRKNNTAEFNDPRQEVIYRKIMTEEQSKFTIDYKINDQWLKRQYEQIKSDIFDELSFESDQSTSSLRSLSMSNNIKPRDLMQSNHSNTL